jgi:hypothetical protein
MPSAAWPKCAAWCAHGRVSIVAWTEPESYELAAELRAAIRSVCPGQPAAPLPAQLRYRDVADFRALFMVASLGEPKIVTVTAKLQAPSARWLAERIACPRHGRRDWRPWRPRTRRHGAIC